MADFFWFSDSQWARRRRGLSAGLWRQENALQPLRALGRARHLGNQLQRARGN
jgi:hypothetical protein